MHNHKTINPHAVTLTRSYWLWVTGIILASALGFMALSSTGCSHDYIELNDAGDDGVDGACEGACPEICDDWVDNDRDGRLDCADPDCAGFPGCAVCGDGLVQPGEDCEIGTMTACTTECGSTGVRSCDGFCRWQDACEPPPESCNEVDDDCDGGVDEGIGNCNCVEVYDFNEGPGSFFTTSPLCGVESVEGLDGSAVQTTDDTCYMYGDHVGSGFALMVKVTGMPRTDQLFDTVWFDTMGGIWAHGESVYHAEGWVHVDVQNATLYINGDRVMELNPGSVEGFRVGYGLAVDNVCIK